MIRMSVVLPAPFGPSRPVTPRLGDKVDPSDRPGVPVGLLDAAQTDGQAHI